MTEAQKCLYHIAENMRMDKSISQEGYEYFQQAIKALEQKPCRDAISREELIKAIDTWDKFGYSARYGLERLDKDDKEYVPYIHYDDVIKCIKGISSVKQEPKTAHWVGHREHCENLGGMPSGLGAYEWCSNCDCGIDVREWHRNHYNYCPNCGADMRGGKE